MMVFALTDNSRAGGRFNAACTLLSANVVKSKFRTMSYKKLITFPDQSQSFTYGVEFGRLLEKIERGDPIVMNNGFPVRVENVDLLKETCKKYGYIPIFGEIYFNEWIDFSGVKEINNN